MNLVRAILIFATVFVVAKRGTCEDHPKSLLGYIRAGQNIALTLEGRTAYDVILLSKEQFQLEQDIRDLDQAALFDKHPDLAEKGRALLSAFVETLKDKPKLGPGASYGEPQVAITSSAGTLHRVIHVGDDYVLLESDEAEPNRILLNSTAIKTVRWYKTPGFTTSVKTIQNRGR